VEKVTDRGLNREKKPRKEIEYLKEKMIT